MNKDMQIIGRLKAIGVVMGQIACKPLLNYDNAVSQPFLHGR
ncbi:hypothetical protein HMPREF0645_0055 [Hallella bergensis DSM 17361]|uniref:Uncharacterized protein n=1 Tax=Hallella bergensis DSM 17361 TaxID=585502 RepID=D1PSU6_9BACT|nr:hypothetical protein HMPREF0645_0055 [Hallella bergensis DSM 17361]